MFIVVYSGVGAFGCCRSRWPPGYGYGCTGPAVRFRVKLAAGPRYCSWWPAVYVLARMALGAVGARRCPATLAGLLMAGALRGRGLPVAQQMTARRLLAAPLDERRAAVRRG